MTEQQAGILTIPKRDRRLLPHVEDPEGIRSNIDRRGSNRKEIHSRFAKFEGRRYNASFRVTATVPSMKKNHKFYGLCTDISQSGMQVLFSQEDTKRLQAEKEACGDLTVIFKFRVPPGTLLEGMEKRANIKGYFVRLDENTGGMGFKFATTLYLHFQRRLDWFLLSMAALFLFLVSFTIALMRYESIFYLRFTTSLSVYSIIAAVFLLSRYFFGALYRPTPVDPSFTPGVTIIIPCFNEEKWISRTILSCVDQDYPLDRLEVIVVDDCSTDHSYRVIQETVALLHGESERFKTKERVKAVRLEKNKGKREALAAGIALSTKEFVTFVDSDSFLEPDAIKNLVQPFFDPKVHGVSGRTDVANTFTNGLTKMQAVRYYIAFRMMKAAESYFDSVMCLSGPLSCYRKQSVLDNLDRWLNQQFLGYKATFGDDRALTQMILRKNRTVYQDTAICSTIVPHTNKVILRQQMRWKRSWLRESLIAATFMWKKEPFMACFFYMGLIIPILAPVIVIYNLIYVPIFHEIFPLTFLIGILCMALLMSFMQLFLRRSSLWLYGLWFCIYYEAILLWQMPWAWVTFWVSTWGTRMTPADEAAQARKMNRKKQRDLHSSKK
ncbi:MAG: glycosyltransferase family 2 protein [Peptococcaceae bacterium]